MADVDCARLDWTFLETAASHSAFAGVASSLVLAVIVVLLGQPRRESSDSRRDAALSLFISAFFVLALDSILFGAIEGEHVCMRAHSEGMIASGLLGIGTVAIFGGMTWLFDLHEEDGKNPGDLTRLAKLCFCAATFATVILIAVTISGLLEKLSTTQAWTIAPPPVWTTWALSVPALLIVTVSAMTRPRDNKGREKALRNASYTSVAYAGISIVVFGWAASLPVSDWEPHAPRLVILVALTTAILFPTASLATLARSLPRPRLDLARASKSLSNDTQLSTPAEEAASSKSEPLAEVEMTTGLPVPKPDSAEQQGR